MDGKDESALRNSAGQQAADTQDGRDQRRDPLPADYGEPPETLQVIPGRFLHEPVPNPAAHTKPGAQPVANPGSAPASPSSVADPSSSALYRRPNASQVPSGAQYPYRDGYTPRYAESSAPTPSAPSAAGGLIAPSQASGQRDSQGNRSSGAPYTSSPAEDEPTLFRQPQASGQGLPHQFAQRGPRSVPVLSRYPTPGRQTPGQLSGVVAGAAPGVAAGALAGAASAVVSGEQGQQNGATPAGAPQEQRPFVVEEVQELPVRGVPISSRPAASQGRSPSAPTSTRASASNQSYLQVGATESAQGAQRGGTQPFAGTAHVSAPSEPYRYQPFASSGIHSGASAAAPQAGAEPWRESLRRQYVPGGSYGAGSSASTGMGQAESLRPGIHASSNGSVTITLSANNAAGFSYLFGWLSGIFFYFTERTNRFVRFHAWQSILLTSLFTVVAVILYVFVEWLTLTPHDTLAVVAGVVGAVLVLLAMFLIWLYTLIAAWSGHYLRLPILGSIAEHFAVPAPDPYAEVDATPGPEVDARG